MRRKTGHRDLRQRELLLPISGMAGTNRWTPESWQSRLIAAIATAEARYGGAQIAVWAESNQRTIENWRDGRNLPSLEAAMSLARHMPEVAAIMVDAIGAPLHKREVA